MLKGFKEFVLRGNVVDLAVGIVIGAAFGELIKSFTASFLTPLIQLVLKTITGGTAISGKAFRINKIDFDHIAFINATITFAITAAALYFLVVTPLNKLAE